MKIALYGNVYLIARVTEVVPDVAYLIPSKKVVLAPESVAPSLSEAQREHAPTAAAG